MNKVILLSCLILAVQIRQSQQQDYTTPVPILKQIDRHNDDGSYTYGYEAADKSYKIETKYPTGEVFGKYGYLDDQGKLREIEYGASKRGFEPAGSDINVPPPTLTNNNHPYPLGPNEVDDGQYREDPAVYYQDQKYNRPAVAASKFSLDNLHQPQRPAYNPPAPQYHNPPAPQYYNPPAQQPVAPSQPNYQQFGFHNQPPQYRPAPPPPPPAHLQSHYQPNYTPQYQPRSYQPQPQPRPQYPYGSLPQHHHPALKHLDIASGSYSIDYTGRRK